MQVKEELVECMSGRRQGLNDDEQEPKNSLYRLMLDGKLNHEREI